MNELLQNIEKVHTTAMGVDRILRNLGLQNVDAVDYCKDCIVNPQAEICRQGKNWYVTLGEEIITVNAYSFTIITAHKRK